MATKKTYRAVLDQYWMLLLMGLPLIAIFTGVIVHFLGQNFSLLILPLGLGLRIMIGLLRCPSCGASLQNGKMGWASERCRNCGAE